MVSLVVTVGNGSMDLYSSRLAAHLQVRTLVTDAYQRSCEVYNVPWLSAESWRTLTKGIELWRLLRRQGGVIHLPNHHLGRFINFLPNPIIITVHDLIRYFDLIGRFPQPLIHRPNSRDRLLLWLDYRGIKRAAKIIAPSHYTRDSLIRHLGLPPQRIEVIYHGVDEGFAPSGEERPLPHPYILYVGSEHPRKNLPFLFRLFRQLRGHFPGLKLVKVGRPGGREADFRAATLSALRELGLEDDVLIYDFVPPQELVRFYSHAQVFCFPSIFEGFGWPPLEAMACGCPVVASSATCIPEILGDGALLCPPDDDEAWLEALTSLLDSPSRRAEMRERGMARARLFSWQEAAQRTLRVYQEVERPYTRGAMAPAAAAR